MYINDYLLSDDVTNKLHSANRSLLTVSNTTGTLAQALNLSVLKKKKKVTPGRILMKYTLH
ncbi:MAG: hypothetical protein ABI184_03260 [Ginsengibacter sp.]